MKISKNQLKKIIKEEIQNMLQEGFADKKASELLDAGMAFAFDKTGALTREFTNALIDPRHRDHETSWESYHHFMEQVLGRGMGIKFSRQILPQLASLQKNLTLKMEAHPMALKKRMAEVGIYIAEIKKQIAARKKQPETSLKQMGAVLEPR